MPKDSTPEKPATVSAAAGQGPGLYARARALRAELVLSTGR